GTVMGELRLTGTLGTELVGGGLPAAADVPAAWADERSTNPGETVPARVSSTAAAHAVRPGIPSGAPTTSTGSFGVRAGAQQLAVTKDAAPGTYEPGDVVDYTITVQNQAPVAGGADVLGLVVADRLPADQTLLHDPALPWSWTVGPGPDRLGTPVFGYDEVTGRMTWTWPQAGRLAPQQTMTLALQLRVNDSLSSTEAVNEAVVSSGVRPFVAA